MTTAIRIEVEGTAGTLPLDLIDELPALIELLRERLNGVRQMEHGNTQLANGVGIALDLRDIDHGESITGDRVDGGIGISNRVASIRVHFSPVVKAHGPTPYGSCRCYRGRGRCNA